jgi:hypothetical protein
MHIGFATLESKNNVIEPPYVKTFSYATSLCTSASVEDSGRLSSFIGSTISSSTPGLFLFLLAVDGSWRF